MPNIQRQLQEFSQLIIFLSLNHTFPSYLQLWFLDPVYIPDHSQYHS